jgi:hypothetical protein
MGDATPLRELKEALLLEALFRASRSRRPLGDRAFNPIRKRAN